MFEVRGIVEMQTALSNLPKLLDARIAGAGYRWCEKVMARSKAEFVPVRTGTLKNSGRVLKPVKVGNRWQFDMVYGGPAAPYALQQHETPWYHHAVGQWKYLETPMLDALPTAAQDIAMDLI